MERYKPLTFRVKYRNENKKTEVMKERKKKKKDVEIMKKNSLASQNTQDMQIHYVALRSECNERFYVLY